MQLRPIPDNHSVSEVDESSESETSSGSFSSTSSEQLLPLIDRSPSPSPVKATPDQIARVMQFVEKAEEEKKRERALALEGSWRKRLKLRLNGFKRPSPRSPRSLTSPKSPNSSYYST